MKYADTNLEKYSLDKYTFINQNYVILECKRERERERERGERLLFIGENEKF